MSSSSQKRSWDEISKEGKNIKRRSCIACQACRAAKTKCDIKQFITPCRRCAASAIPCLLPESRRGRMRGSKNRRTLEQLLNHTEATLVARSGITAESRPYSCSRSSPETTARVRQVTPDQRHSTLNYDMETQSSGMVTPLDPVNLMSNLDEHWHGNSRRLRRKFLHILGEQFPVLEGKEPAEPESNQGGFQDPLPSITNIAKRGWNLDECDKAQRVRHITALATTELPPEDARLLEKWTPQALQEIMGDITRYFEYGLRGSKMDVARDLDPLQRGMITEVRGQELFDAFWEHVHPQWAMLGPEIHTVDFVRSRSALLTTTILALGSIALATLNQRTNGQVAEAMTLHAHTEKLSLVIYSTGARSIEIVQAQILLSRFSISSRTRLDEQRWIRSAMIPRLAAEIGLSCPRRPEADTSINEEAEKLRWNDLRTRAFMILNEHRFFAFSGRVPMDLSHFELDQVEIDEITHLGADHPSSSLPAFYDLYLFQREIHQRLDRTEPGPRTALQLDADANWVGNYTGRWIAKWCHEGVPSRTRWHLVHDALSCQLLLSARIARKFPQSADLTRHRLRLLDISLEIFQTALERPHAIHMTHRASIFPFAGAIVLRLSDRRDVVLRLALRMAGELGKAYVPTFVRNAGNQLLAMLCANQSKSLPPLQIAGGLSKTLASTSDQVPSFNTTVAKEDSQPQRRSSTDRQLENKAILGRNQDEQPARLNDVTQQNELDPGLQLLIKKTQVDNWLMDWTLPAADSAIADGPLVDPSSFIDFDVGFDFPYVPTTMSPQAPFLASEEIALDFGMLVGAETFAQPGKMELAGMQDHISSVNTKVTGNGDMWDIG